MAGDSCDVCGKPSIGVASSSFGAVSWAFCKECVSKPAEPECMFCYLYDDVSDKGEGLKDEVNTFYTFIDGKYVSWPDYVAKRRAA
jgi:hypothetical protein